MKRCSTSLIIKEVQIRTMWDIISYLLQWISSKGQEITSVGEEREKRELLFTAGGKVNWHNNYGKQYSSMVQSTKTWMGLEGIMLNEISQKMTNTIWFHSYVKSKTTQNQLPPPTTKRNFRYRKQISAYQWRGWRGEPNVWRASTGQWMVTRFVVVITL